MITLEHQLIRKPKNERSTTHSAAGYLFSGVWDDTANQFLYLNLLCPLAAKSEPLELKRCETYRITQLAYQEKVHARRLFRLLAID